MKPDWSKVPWETNFPDIASDRAERLSLAAMNELQFEQDIANKVIQITSSGLSDLDKTIRGFLPQRFYVVAGRPSMGKTSLALSFLKHSAKAGKRCLYFSPDQSKGQLAIRLLSDELGSFKYSNVHKHIKEALEGVEAIEDWDIYINDQSPLTAQDIDDISEEFQPDILVVDYLQIMKPEHGHQNRYREISDISHSLKALAKNRNIPVIAVCQLSRGVDSRVPPIPCMSDLKESGDIEQDADVVMLLYRPEYYLRRKMPEDAAEKEKIEQKLEDWKNVAQIIVDKNKQGPTNTLKVYCDLATSRFGDLV